MRICTNDECVKWCAAHGYPTGQMYSNAMDLALETMEPAFQFAKFSLPEDAGRRVALVKNLFQLLDEKTEVLVQISDWSVWPSGEHMPLFDRFRQALGENRPLSEAPGHIIPIAEREDALSILVISVLYLWNCHVLSAGGDQALFLSHDEFGWFAVRGTRTLEPVTELLEQFGVLRQPAGS